ncbi:MAG: two-component regulator propeller domain-containing protein, partial [Chlorobiota bacterium]
MRRGLQCVLLGVALGSSAALADVVPRIERWELHTSLLTVRGVTTDGERLWAATSGGLFAYAPQTGQLTTVRRTEGLLTHDFTAIAAGDGYVVAGSFDGIVEVRDTTGEWYHVTDIYAQPGLPSKQITAILLRGPYAYLGTGFGLVLLELRRRIIAQSVLRIGGFQAGTAVTALCAWRDTLWVGTASGLAAIRLDAPFLGDPGAWSVIQSRELSSGVRFLLPMASALVVATATGVFLYRDGAIEQLRTYSQPVVGIASYRDSLWVATRGEVWQELPTRQQLVAPIATLSGMWGNVVGGSFYLLVGAEEQGLWGWDGQRWHPLRPNSPHTNLLLSCAVDAEGNLWCATDRTAGRGFACLYRGQWYGFTTATAPQLGVNEYHRAFVSAAGREAWFAGWGRGLIQVVATDTGFVLTRYDAATTPLRGIPSDTMYLAIGELTADATGNLWGVCHWCASGALFRRTPDGQIESFATGLPTSQRQNLPLVVDPFGTKWFGSLVSDGLFYFREAEGGRPEVLGRLTTASSALPSNIIYALAVDREGMVWVGTPSGVGVVLNPGAVLSGSSPVVRNVSLLREQAVYAIAVDVHNNKWLATDAGLWVVNPDATAVLLRLTAENSPLPSSGVRGVTIEHQSGRVFVGTRAGLAVLETSARLPQGSYSLRCFPQPFVPERDEVLRIDGLAEQSIIRVLTLEGLVVARFQTSGRMAYWDGRNERGELVPEGVYIITALSAATGEWAQAKVLL